MITDDIRQRSWDFGLTVLTVVLLGSLGVQSFLGTLYVWWAQRTVPLWEQVYYDSFVTVMNAMSSPMASPAVAAAPTPSHRLPVWKTA